MKLLRVVGIMSMLLAGVSVFIFPWTLTVILGAIASLTFPPSALALGLLSDTLYYPGTGLPAATVVGAVGMMLAYVVRRFLKNRIL